MENHFRDNLTESHIHSSTDFWGACYRNTYDSGKPKLEQLINQTNIMCSQGFEISDPHYIWCTHTNCIPVSQSNIRCVGNFFVFSAVDPTIEEAIASVIWCEPRLSADIPELMIVSILSCISWMKFVAPSNEMNSFHCAYYPTSHLW